jgi:hypothetical protein
MAQINNRLTAYTAPDGFVYDFAEPRETIIITDGKKEVIQDHLYAKFLYLNRFDNIKNYVLVKDPKNVGTDEESIT